MQILQNGIEVPTNSDSYNLTDDLANMGNTTNVVTLVATQSVRDALTKYDGLAVRRLDLVGRPMETWDGVGWVRSPVVITGNLSNDGFWSITGKVIKTTLADVTVVQLIATLIRTGPAITINVADSSLLLNMVPAGFRPSGNHYFNAPINTDLAGARYAEPQFIIGDSGNGNLIARSISGGPVTVSTNYAMFLNTMWYI